ncbi:hypothetical protein [Pedobacter faecalis]|uniref:hypothetical protein n=1 Tax=Pedobacter faecalis TaxID=3041495 RepID=UPI00254A39D1|nr:hypothetical protein [Pedobacter sp. ELA7]
MGDSIAVTSLSLFGCLILGISVAWMLYRHNTFLDRRLKLGLATIRALVITAIAFLILAPLIRGISFLVEKPVIAIAIDNSESVRAIEPVSFNAGRFESQMNRIANTLSKQYEVRLFSFSDSVKSALDFNYAGKVTNGTALANRIANQLSGRNIGAVVLASDGIFNRGGNPVNAFKKLNAPFYTVMLGDTVPKRDVRITNVHHNQIAFLGDEFVISVQVQAVKSDGETTFFSVEQDGKEVYRNRLVITGDAFAKEMLVRLKATKTGIQKFRLKVGELEHEISRLNNQAEVFIEVSDARRKILIAAAGPHPDISAYKQSLTSNTHFDVKVVLGDDLSRTDPSNYNLIVLYQLPSNLLTETAFLNLVGKSKAARWYVTGAQTNIAGFNRLQNRVNLQQEGGGLQEKYAFVDERFGAFRVGVSDARKLGNFAPLLSPPVSLSIPGDASIVLKSRSGKTGTGEPLLFLTSEGTKRSAYLMGEGLWRWRLSDLSDEGQPDLLDQLLPNVAQYLTVNDDKRKFDVYTLKNGYGEQDNVVFNAVLYDDNYQQLNTPDVSLELRNKLDGRRFNFLFSRTEAGYTLDAGFLPPGEYTYSAAAVSAGRKLADSGTFHVTELRTEFQETTANHELLKSLAAQTNGEWFEPDSVNHILERIRANEQIRSVSYEDRRYTELVNYKWLFWLIVSLLGLEWLMRKRNAAI